MLQCLRWIHFAPQPLAIRPQLRYSLLHFSRSRRFKQVFHKQSSPTVNSPNQAYLTTSSGKALAIVFDFEGQAGGALVTQCTALAAGGWALLQTRTAGRASKSCRTSFARVRTYLVNVHSPFRSG